MIDIILDGIVQQALREDIHTEDITTRAIAPPHHRAHGTIAAKAPGVISGTAAARRTFQLLCPEVTYDGLADGASVAPGDVVASVSGPAWALLTGERVALNFMQRLSGIATATRGAVQAAAPHKARIVDTRKTTPGLRYLEKAAIRHGGGHNHRFGLYDGVMIKENHIAVAGGITEAVKRVRAYCGHMVKVEVEVEHLSQLEEALTAGVDVIMLDNMSVEHMREAVHTVDGQTLLEASGNITPSKVAAVAATGVDVISLGWLTHSVPALDLSLLLDA